MKLKQKIGERGQGSRTQNSNVAKLLSPPFIPASLCRLALMGTWLPTSAGCVFTVSQSEELEGEGLESDSRILALPFIWANYVIFWVSDSFSEQWDNHRISAVFSCSVMSDSLRSIPMDCSLPGPSVHGVLQARILEWVAMPFFRGSSQPRDKNPGLLHCRQILYHLSLPGKAQSVNLLHKN